MHRIARGDLVEQRGQRGTLTLQFMHGNALLHQPLVDQRGADIFQLQSQQSGGAVVLDLHAVNVLHDGAGAHHVVAGDQQAADAGIEKILTIRDNPINIPATPLSNGATYEVSVRSAGFLGCAAANYCIKSLGSYKETNRAIEISY